MNLPVSNDPWRPPTREGAHRKAHLQHNNKERAGCKKRPHAHGACLSCATHAHMSFQRDSVIRFASDRSREEACQGMRSGGRIMRRANHRIRQIPQMRSAPRHNGKRKQSHVAYTSLAQSPKLNLPSPSTRQPSPSALRTVAGRPPTRATHPPRDLRPENQPCEASRRPRQWGRPRRPWTHP